MTSAITPEVVGLDKTELLLDTDLTPTELARVEALETKLRMSDATVLEQKIIQGETLFRIQQERLYRSRQPGERYSWEQYLQRFTPALTKNGKGYGQEAAQLRCLLYLFHSGQISARAARGENLLMPTGTEQLQPLLRKSPSRHASQGGGFDLDGDWTAVIEIWKTATSTKVNPDRQTVALARTAWEKNQLLTGGDPGRMISPAQQASLERANAAKVANQSKSAELKTPAPEPVPTAAFTSTESNLPPIGIKEPVSPTIPAWELEKDDSSLDAGTECRKVWHLLQDCSKAVSTLRGQLYSSTAKYGSSYLTFLREVDAGAYSIANIDHQLAQLIGDLQFVESLLDASYDPGELTRNTIDISEIPTRA